MFLLSNHLLLTIIQLRTPLISPKILLNKVQNWLWLSLMWILFSQIYHLMKLLKCVNELFKSSQTDLWHNKQLVLEILLLTTKENVLLLGQKSCSQIDGVAMGSPLGPTLDNIFLCHHETTWLKNSLKSFKPVYYKRYVDDIFVLFENPK